MSILLHLHCAFPISCRAKALIKAQRHTAYWKKHGRQGSSAFPTKPLLNCSPYHTPMQLHLEARSIEVGQQPRNPPAELVAMAAFNVPVESHLFQEAVKSAHLLGETGLEIWETGPPYATSSVIDTIHETRYMQQLVEVMHGCYARTLRERLQSQDMQTLQETYNSVLENWEVGIVFLDSYQGSDREMIMARIWLQWQAREAHMLYLKLVLD